MRGDSYCLILEILLEVYRNKNLNLVCFININLIIHCLLECKRISLVGQYYLTIDLPVGIN